MSRSSGAPAPEFPDGDADAAARALTADELGDLLAVGAFEPAVAEAALDWLVERAVDDPDEGVQEAALNALAGAFDGYELPLRLFSRLRSRLATLPRVLLAAHALYVLAATHDAAVRPDIETCLQHPHPSVRSAAEHALIELRGRAATGAPTPHSRSTTRRVSRRS